MFDHVGRSHGRKRSATAFLLALGLNGGAIGTLALLTRQVAETVTEKAQEKIEQFVPIHLTDLPAPPKGGGSPPARRPAAHPAQKLPTSPPPATERSALEPTPLLPEAQPAPPTGGDPGDPGGGSSLGRGTGIGTGKGPAAGKGDGSGEGLVEVDWSTIQVRRRVFPDFPDAARAAGIRSATCVVVLRIDGGGVPTEAVPESCPAAFAPSLSPLRCGGGSSHSRVTHRKVHPQA